MVSRLSGHSSRTLHSATPAPNTPPTSRLSPLFRTLSDMGQAATKLGHGGACVATPKHAPPLRGKLQPTPLPRKNIPKMFIVAGPRPRRAKRPARPSLPTRVSRGSTATAQPAARARDERPPASTEDPVRSVSRPVVAGVELVLFVSRRAVGFQSEKTAPPGLWWWFLHERAQGIQFNNRSCLAHPSLPSPLPFRQTSKRPDGASPCTTRTSSNARALRARAWTSPPPAATPSTSGTRPRGNPSTSPPSETRSPTRPFADASVSPARRGRRGHTASRARTNTSIKKPPNQVL